MSPDYSPRRCSVAWAASRDREAPDIKPARATSTRGKPPRYRDIASALANMFSSFSSEREGRCDRSRRPPVLASRDPRCTIVFQRIGKPSSRPVSCEVKMTAPWLQEGQVRLSHTADAVDQIRAQLLLVVRDKPIAHVRCHRFPATEPRVPAYAVHSKRGRGCPCRGEGEGRERLLHGLPMARFRHFVGKLRLGVEIHRQ